MFSNDLTKVYWNLVGDAVPQTLPYFDQVSDLGWMEGEGC